MLKFLKYIGLPCAQGFLLAHVGFDVASWQYWAFLALFLAYGSVCQFCEWENK